MNGILTHATSVSPTTATTAATELTAAQVAETNAAIYVKANAKNPGTKSFARYAKYQPARSAKEHTALGGFRAGLRHDLRQGLGHQCRREMVRSDKFVEQCDNTIKNHG